MASTMWRPRVGILVNYSEANVAYAAGAGFTSIGLWAQINGALAPGKVTETTLADDGAAARGGVHDQRRRSRRRIPREPFDPGERYVNGYRGVGAPSQAELIAASSNSIGCAAAKAVPRSRAID